MFEELKAKLEGCFYTIFTPFDATGEVDYGSLEKYLGRLYAQGARRFYAMAYNSRYSQLTNDEIRNLNEFCIIFLKKLDNKNIVIVGDPIQCSTAMSVNFAQHAKDAGADLISLIVGEKYFSDDQILEHFSHVGLMAQMPILVHEMPFLSGYDGNQMHWPKSLLRSLPKIPQIIALKEDAKNFEVTTEALALEPRIRVIIAGTKKSLIDYRPHGARAYLNGISIINARIGEIFWTAYQAMDDEVVEFIIQEIERPFFELCVSKYGWHRSSKALIQAAGMFHRRDRMPLKHLSDNEFRLVRDVYGQIRDTWAKRFGGSL